MMNSNSYHDMFRSTKVWNEVLHAFYVGIPLKRHRKHMKAYNDCFVASDAVQWLHNYLLNCPHFSIQIQRTQAVLLLQKYQKTGYIEHVVQKKNRKFEDNKQLFWFTQHIHESMCSSNTIKSPQLEECNELLKSCENVLRRVSNDNNTFKSVLPKTDCNVNITKQMDDNCLVLQNPHNYVPQYIDLTANVSNDLPQYHTSYYQRRFMTVPLHRCYNQNCLPHSSIEHKFNDCQNDYRRNTKNVCLKEKPITNFSNNSEHVCQLSSSCGKNEQISSNMKLLKAHTVSQSFPLNECSESKSDAPPFTPHTPPQYSFHHFLQTQLTEYI